MGLALLCSELVTLGQTALAACGRPVDRAYRYQGPNPRVWPCPAEGELVVWQARTFVSPRLFGQPGLPDPGMAAPRFDEVFVRVVRCFPGMKNNGEPAEWDRVDVATASLDDDLDCLWFALQQAVCRDAWVHTAGCSRVLLADAKPMPPRGQTAGHEIRLLVAPNP